MSYPGPAPPEGPKGETVPAKYKVSIKKNAKTAVVRPASDKVNKGGQIKIENKTGADIIVRMPDNVFSTGANPRTIPNGQTEDFDVKANADEGVYDFTIFSVATFSFAQANSDPEFIIE
jgi:hypothetical protein